MKLSYPFQGVNKASNIATKLSNLTQQRLFKVSSSVATLLVVFHSQQARLLEQVDAREDNTDIFPLFVLEANEVHREHSRPKPVSVP